MSHDRGTYLGGIRTVECLRQRSRDDPDTGCWHWGMGMSCGAPTVHFVAPDTGEHVRKRGRAAAMYLLLGCPPKPGMVAFARTNCDSDDCVNPGHSRYGNRDQHGAWLRSTGKVKGGRRPAACKAAWDKRGRKLQPDDVADIRSSAETTHAIAKRLGVSQCAVWLARQGKTHKHVLVGQKAASVFDWRA